VKHAHEQWFEKDAAKIPRRHACPAARSTLLYVTIVLLLLIFFLSLSHSLPLSYRYKDIAPIITVLSWVHAWRINVGSAIDTDRSGIYNRKRH